MTIYKNIFFSSLLDQPQFRFVVSKRGTTQVFYDGNTFTPNEKGDLPHHGRKTWKCTQYYKQNCKARLTTTIRNGQSLLKSSAIHSHSKMYQTKQEIQNLLNFR